MIYIPLRIRYAGLSALLLGWPIVHAIGQGIDVRMAVDGRTFSLVASAPSIGPRIFQNSIIQVQGNT